MKRILLSFSVFALAALISINTKAEGLEGMTDFHLIWLDADTEYDYEIEDQIVQDLRVREDLNRNFYIWDDTYSPGAVTGKGYFGQIGGFTTMDVKVGKGWSGLGFNLSDEATYEIDYSTLTEDHRFHMAFKSNYSAPHQIQVYGQKDIGAKFSVGVGMQDNMPNVTPNFKLNEWNLIDLSMAQFRELGFSNRASFKGNYFVILSGPGPNSISIDAIFFYRPQDTRLNNTKADELKVIVTKNIVEVLNATQPIEIYDVSGTLVKKSVEPIFGVDLLNKGVYIIKSGSAVSKVIIR